MDSACRRIGSFTVAIFASFLLHFCSHFCIIFIVWQKNGYKMKQKMKTKNVTVNAPNIPLPAVNLDFSDIMTSGVANPKACLIA